MKLIVTCLVVSVVWCFPGYGAPKTTDPGREISPRVQYGLASWYGDREQGRPMASGEPFNAYAMIAAHRTLPLGTAVKVTNVRNGRSVVVRIMDRGPHVAGRAIDLSKAAADRLRFTRQGLALVRIRVLRTPDEQWREAELTRPALPRHRPTAPSANTRPRREVSSRRPEAFTRQ